MNTRLAIFCTSTLLALSCTRSDPLTEDPAFQDPDDGAHLGRVQHELAEIAGVPLRYLSLNVGNASFQYGCWEYKLCRPEDVTELRAYIRQWQPDIILLSEVYRAGQLTGTANGGPILPSGYTGVCGKSIDRDTGALVAYNADNASHEHECIAWKTNRLSLIAGSEQSAYGRNDFWGKDNCSYDFTGFRARLMLDGTHPITAVTVHPDSKNVDCRTEEIARYWSELAQGTNVIIGGDFNTSSAAEIQRRASYTDNFAGGSHWNIATHDEYTAFYIFGVKYKYDWAYSNVGAGCTSCGAHYGTADLTYGSVVGGYHGMPRADGGDGMDHRQILVDMVLTGNGGTCAHEPFTTGAALADGCSACAASVCATDSYCCSTSWDSICVDLAEERCTSCSHSTNVTGAPLFNGCNECVTMVCNADPWCCNISWDSVCVNRASNSCS